MPDIDVDFEYAERSRVIEYVTEKYGKDSVTQITTFGTMAARGVIKAVGKSTRFSVCGDGPCGKNGADGTEHYDRPCPAGQPGIPQPL